MTPTRRTRWGGTVAIEAAMVLPVMFLFLFGIIVLGHTVFRFQLVTCQAREAARWAAVRGGDYERDTGGNAPTVRQITEQAVLPMAMGMDPNALTLEVRWTDKGTNTEADWDAASKEVRSITPAGEYVSNTVRATVSYQWAPGVLIDPVTLRGVCELPMCR